MDRPDIISLSQHEFIQLFDLPYLGYDTPTEFIDDNFGFSTVKDRPNEYASLLRIFISKKDLTTSNTLFPITIEATYGEKTSGGIRLSTNTPSDPIELLSIDEFYFNPVGKKFLRKNGVFRENIEIEPRKIIEEIDELHTKPTRKIRGLWLRVKIIFWRTFVAGFLKFISNGFVFLLDRISGIKISRDPWARLIFPERLEEQEKEEMIHANPEKSIDFFGYKASLRTITFYCYFHFIIFLVFFLLNYKPTIVTTIFKNSFLTIIYVISTLVLLDVILPKLLKRLIKWTDKLFYLSSSRRIEI